VHRLADKAASTSARLGDEIKRPSRASQEGRERDYLSDGVGGAHPDASGSAI
jgi:hypothetical protein